MPTFERALLGPVQHRSEYEPLKSLIALNTGVMLLSVTHDILFITPDAVRMLRQLWKFDGHSPATIQLPSIIHEMCREMVAAWHRCDSTQDGTSIQMRRLTPSRRPRLRLGGYIVPERGRPPTCRLLIIFERLSHLPQPHDTQTPASATSLHPLLTVRQESVARGLIRGLTNKELANELALSTHTIKDYVRIIMAKLNVTTRAGVVARLIGASRQEDPIKSWGWLNGPMNL